VIKSVYWSPYKVPVIYVSQTLVKLELSGQIFEKYSNINFHENPYSGRRVVSCGRTDRHDEA